MITGEQGSKIFPLGLFRPLPDPEVSRRIPQNVDNPGEYGNNGQGRGGIQGNSARKRPVAPFATGKIPQGGGMEIRRTISKTTTSCPAGRHEDFGGRNGKIVETRRGAGNLGEEPRKSSGAKDCAQARGKEAGQKAERSRKKRRRTGQKRRRETVPRKRQKIEAEESRQKKKKQRKEKDGKSFRQRSA